MFASVPNGLPEQIGENIDTFQIITYPLVAPSARLETGSASGANALVVVNDTTLYQTDDWGLNWGKVAAIDGFPRLSLVRRINSSFNPFVCHCSASGVIIGFRRF